MSGVRRTGLFGLQGNRSLALRRHGGVIEVENVESWARFCITLPVSDETGKTDVEETSNQPTVDRRFCPDDRRDRGHDAFVRANG